MTECSYCGIIFSKYTALRNRRIAEIEAKMHEGKLEAAKSLCKQLLLYYPERSAEDHSLFDKITTEINRPFINDRLLAEGRYALKDGNIESAKECSSKITEYDKANILKKEIEAFKSGSLKEAITLVRNKKFDSAEKKFSDLTAKFPEAKEEAKGYISFLDERNKLKNDLLAAASNAKNEGRLIDSKVLFFFLGMQFPEILSAIRPAIQEIGTDAMICLADLDKNGIIDFAGLGIDANHNGIIDIVSAAIDTNKDGLADMLAGIVDVNHDGVADIMTVAVDANHDGSADMLATVIDTNNDGVADMAEFDSGSSVADIDTSGFDFSF